MHLLSPLGGLLGLLGIVPLVAFALAERRRSRVTALLGLAEPGRRSRLLLAAALATVAALLGLAATQPTLVRRTARSVRSDAEAYVVFDTSRSMLAAPGRHEPDRLERARRLALALRARLPDIPFGIASMTDRVLPHLFPTPDLDAFAAAVHQSVGIERPPPLDGFGERITTLGSLSRLGSDNFYSPAATHRLVVVFTDGETKPFVDASVGTVLGKPPAIRPIFVRIWGADERVFLPGGIDPNYVPDPIGAVSIPELAAVTNGVGYSSADLGRIVASARRFLGKGPATAQVEERRKLAFAPFVVLAAFLPLGFLLRRRNL